MLITTIDGVVSYRKGGKLSILLRTRKTIKVNMPNLTLELGDKCIVAFNNETGKVANIYPINATLPNEEQEAPPEPDEVPEFEDCPSFMDLGSVLGDRGLMEYLE